MEGTWKKNSIQCALSCGFEYDRDTLAFHGACLGIHSYAYGTLSIGEKAKQEGRGQLILCFAIILSPTDS